MLSLVNLVQRFLCRFASDEIVRWANRVDEMLRLNKMDTLLVIVGPFGFWVFYDTEFKRFIFGKEKDDILVGVFKTMLDKV